MVNFEYSDGVAGISNAAGAKELSIDDFISHPEEFHFSNVNQYLQRVKYLSLHRFRASRKIICYRYP